MQRRQWLAVAFVLIAVGSTATYSPAAEKPAWKAGTAQKRITTKLPIWLAGYGHRDRPAEGALHDLWIKVLALESEGGDRAVLVTGDLLGFPRGMSQAICADLKKRHGLDRSQIMLTCSHTHTGPVLRDALYDIYPLDDRQRTLIDMYSEALEKTVIAAVTEALVYLKPATLSAAEGRTDFAVNRRNNREADVPTLREQGKELKGPVDHDVPVLAVRSPKGALRAVIFGYACHATTLSSYKFSGDYPGFAQIELQRRHPDVMAMFYAGCGADQNPIPRRSVEFCRAYGERLASAVDEVLDKPMRPVESGLRTAFETIELDFQGPPTRDELDAAAAGSGYRARWAKRLLRQLDDGQPFAKSYPYPVQVWPLGGKQLWISLGGEVVVDYSLRFKTTYGPTTWVAGYANDVMAYIPSRRVWEEGGYEAGAFEVYGLPTLRWAPGVEKHVVDSVQRLVKESGGRR